MDNTIDSKQSGGSVARCPSCGGPLATGESAVAARRIDWLATRSRNFGIVSGLGLLSCISALGSPEVILQLFASITGVFSLLGIVAGIAALIRIRLVGGNSESKISALTGIVLSQFAFFVSIFLFYASTPRG